MSKFYYGILLAVLTSCGGKTSNESSVEPGDGDVEFADATAIYTDYDELINAVYDKFVFGFSADGTENPEDYFTENALNKLREDYEYDCEDGDCYAFYALRTNEHDAKPGAEDLSRIESIMPGEDDWYTVSYLDMGWSGTTGVKIINGKIDDYERCITAM